MKAAPSALVRRRAAALAPAVIAAPSRANASAWTAATSSSHGLRSDMADQSAAAPASNPSSCGISRIVACGRPARADRLAQECPALPSTFAPGGLGELRFEARELLLRHRVAVGGIGKAAVVHLGDVLLERGADGLPDLRVRLH